MRKLKVKHVAMWVLWHPSVSGDYGVALQVVECTLQCTKLGYVYMEEKPLPVQQVPLSMSLKWPKRKARANTLG